MSELTANIVFFALLVCSAACFYRIGRGPSAPDRAVAIDILGIVIVCFTAVFTVLTGRDFYMNIGIAWAILSFIGTIALAKHLEGKSFDE